MHASVSAGLLDTACFASLFIEDCINAWLEDTYAWFSLFISTPDPVSLLDLAGLLDPAGLLDLAGLLDGAWLTSPCIGGRTVEDCTDK